MPSSARTSAEDFHQESVGAKETENSAVLDSARHDGPVSARVLEMLHATAELPERDPMQPVRSVFNGWIGFTFDGDGHHRYAASLGFLQNEERKPSAAGNEPNGLRSLITTHHASNSKKGAANKRK
jgi:hypothetical protein